MEYNKFSDTQDDDFAGRVAWEHFGIKYLFPWQRLVIANILDSYDNGRQIVLLPTGAGKSICFQVPALILEGPTLVIYPLLALMSDQKRRMEEAEIDCVIFKGGQTESEREENFSKIKKGAKIILANPEILQNESLILRLCECKIKHVAIDEAHCVSEWGDSFRPSYLELGKVIKKINPPLITAFTATASPEVLERINEILFDKTAHIVRSESDRPNIKYYVKKAAAKKKEALYLSCTEEKPMLIFCGTRNKAEDLAMDLNLLFGEEKVKFYHAGLSREEKDKVEKWFYNSTEGILCSTCAYGMGIDKQNIRTVIHLEVPQSVEAYIQEAGRSGRDGKDSKAILIWSLSDSINSSSDKRQKPLKNFAETTLCRRQALLDALGAEKAFCNGCDLCEQRNAGIKNKKTVCDWKEVLKLIKQARNFYSDEDLEEEIKNRFNEKAQLITGRRIWNHSDAQEIIAQLKESGKIIKGGIFWKNRLTIANSRRHLRLPLLPRRNLQQQEPELVQASELLPS